MLQSSVSSKLEDALEVVARKQNTTRFVKLHHEIAEMSHIEAPALLAYKGGDVISTIVDIPRQIPHHGKITSTSVEDLLKRYDALPFSFQSEIVLISLSFLSLGTTSYKTVSSHLYQNECRHTNQCS